MGAANILKQEMLSRGGEAVLEDDIYRIGRKPTNVLLLGTRRHYDDLLRKLRLQPLESLQRLVRDLEEALALYLQEDRGELNIGRRAFRWGERTYVMGIVNVTPDSFSGDGLGADIEEAVAQARRFAQEGADIVDIGGESTRPRARAIPAQEEMDRVLPVIERLAGEMDVPVSIDTYKASVAQAALEAGAQMVNDVWGLRRDGELAGVVARWGVPVVVMHNRERGGAAVVSPHLGGSYQGAEYEDLMADIVRELRQSVGIATQAGIPRQKIIVDPGIGFAKTVAQSIEALRRLAELKVLGCPILIGTSRKSLVGYTLDLPTEERLEGTAATVAIGIANGADIVRVHDVREMTRVARMTDALVRSAPGGKGGA
jgi:dihydropteroate synthase